MHKLEYLIERVILGSRWLLVIFILGLAAALAVYGISFCVKLYTIALHTFDYDPNEMILAMLALIDAALVASLIVMVMISSYENFVSRFDANDHEDKDQVSFLGKLDSGSLKIKVASSIVAISSIHMLQVFLNLEKYENEKIMLIIAMHLTFVVSALLLGFLEKMNAKPKSPGPGGA
ncbi:TIGR00645 family protein [Asticcacaulis benevestitus]|uniref:UPF0114 protein ABENE_03655 n=1 Tax=Asticcacaulis benevestitus DSM 16100 = ATCC BAA-896 TaxID=1121022 RepID=V4PZI6_9CAUL|nr:TIGR00645 family protein [Asticcacaulis benevestitus]ESQ93791.1 hypothetical protein ABENE_03655 [Asticcacaulis benevestitus DSM 16100 = ATCC BAA-896]